MRLVQILLPKFDNDGKAFPSTAFEAVASELTSRFGGLTAYTRSPAEGRWRDQGETKHDDVVVLEVMVDTVDRCWWRSFRVRMEKVFRQERIIVRAQRIDII